MPNQIVEQDGEVRVSHEYDQIDRRIVSQPTGDIPSPGIPRRNRGGSPVNLDNLPVDAIFHE